MKLSSSNIKEIIIFSEMKPYTFLPQPSKFLPKKFLIFFRKKAASKKSLIFFQKKAFVIFPEMKPCTF